MEAAAGEKAHTEGTGLPLHRGSQEASMRGSKSWRVASMPSLCFPCFGLFYRTNEGNRGSNGDRGFCMMRALPRFGEVGGFHLLDGERYVLGGGAHAQRSRISASYGGSLGGYKASLRRYLAGVARPLGYITIRLHGRRRRSCFGKATHHRRMCLWLLLLPNCFSGHRGCKER